MDSVSYSIMPHRRDAMLPLEIVNAPFDGLMVGMSPSSSETRSIVLPSAHTSKIPRYSGKAVPNRHLPQKGRPHAHQTSLTTAEGPFSSLGRVKRLEAFTSTMSHLGGSTKSAQAFATPRSSWVDKESNGTSPLPLLDQSFDAGPSSSAVDYVADGRHADEVDAALLSVAAAEVKPVKKKKKGWKGWAVVTQDEHGNLVEVKDDLPEGVVIKPLRAPASATIKPEQGLSMPLTPASSDAPASSRVGGSFGSQYQSALDGRVVGDNGFARQPRRAAALANVITPQASSSRRTSPKLRSLTPVPVISAKKRKRPSEIQPAVSKKTLHRPAGRGSSLPSASTEDSGSPMIQLPSPDLRKALAANSISSNMPFAAKTTKSLKSKGKERERQFSLDPPDTGSSSRPPSTASTPVLDMYESTPLPPPVDMIPITEDLPTPPASPLRLGMGIAQSPPDQSDLRSEPMPADRPRSPPEARWRALPPEPEDPDILLYAPAVPPEPDRPVPHENYTQANPSPPRSRSTYELQYESGFSGLTPAMERDAVGFMNNIRTNLDNLLSYTCPQPSVARTAFVESLGRRLQELGWKMTDQGDL